MNGHEQSETHCIIPGFEFLLLAEAASTAPSITGVDADAVIMSPSSVPAENPCQSGYDEGEWVIISSGSEPDTEPHIRKADATPVKAEIVSTGPTMLDELREAFVRMTVHPEIDAIKEKMLKGRPIEAEAGLWSMIFDSFDLTTSPYIDLDKPAEEQPLDVRLYLFAVGRAPCVSRWDKKGATDFVGTYNELPSHRKWTVADGLDLLKRCLQFGHGLYVAPLPDDEDKGPFPWVDKHMSRFQKYSWAWVPGATRYDVDYNDEPDPDDPLGDSIEYSEHLRPFKYRQLLLTNLRPILPTVLLQNEQAICEILRSAYGDEHIVTAMADARTWASNYRDPDNDMDIRAGMLMAQFLRIYDRWPTVLADIMIARRRKEAMEQLRLEPTTSSTQDIA